jgi:hypothetical protein
MSACGKCEQPISRTKTSEADKLYCKSCKSYFHIACLNIKQNDLTFLRTSSWFCPNCVGEQRNSGQQSSDSIHVKTNVFQDTNMPSGSVTSMKSLEQLINDGHNKFFASIEELKNIVKTGQDRQNELSNIISRQSEIIDRQQELIETLRGDVGQLRVRLQLSEERIDEQEQYARRNTLEIHGVPEKENENVLETIADVGQAVGFNVTPCMVDACHRLVIKRGNPAGVKTQTRPPAAIIVKFVRRFDADQLMEFRRKSGVLRRQQVQGLEGQGPIYVNRSLTSKRRKLLGMARQLKKRGAIKDAWVDRTGSIRIRRDENDKFPLVIKSDHDLNFPRI